MPLQCIRHQRFCNIFESRSVPSRHHCQDKRVSSYRILTKINRRIIFRFHCSFQYSIFSTTKYNLIMLAKKCYPLLITHYMDRRNAKWRYATRRGKRNSLWPPGHFQNKRTITPKIFTCMLLCFSSSYDKLFINLISPHTYGFSKVFDDRS